MILYCLRTILAYQVETIPKRAVLWARNGHRFPSAQCRYLLHEGPNRGWVIVVVAIQNQTVRTQILDWQLLRDTMWGGYRGIRYTNSVHISTVSSRRLQAVALLTHPFVRSRFFPHWTVAQLREHCAWTAAPRWRCDFRHRYRLGIAIASAPPLSPLQRL